MILRLKYPEREAFTLLEVLVSTVLIVSGVVAVVGALSSGLYADRQTVDSQVVALGVAQGQLELIRNTPYVNINTTTFPTGLNALSGDLSSYSMQTMLYSSVAGSVFSALGSGSNYYPLTKAAVYISWVNGAQQGSLTLTTLLAEHS
ncbi:MAG: hypothetical protein HQL13_03605 [Candidatus Omnitrophica bacterium]|nr:hypothetical protein [Candidatus Omnitrophota bacterium]